MNATSPRKQSGETSSSESQPTSLQASNPALGIFLTGLAGIGLAVLAGGSSKKPTPSYRYKPVSKITIEGVDYSFHMSSGSWTGDTYDSISYRLISSTGIDESISYSLVKEPDWCLFINYKNVFPRTSVPTDTYVRSLIRSFTDSVCAVKGTYSHWISLNNWIQEEINNHMPDEFKATLGEYFEHHRKLKAEPPNPAVRETDEPSSFPTNQW